MYADAGGATQPLMEAAQLLTKVIPPMAMEVTFGQSLFSAVTSNILGCPSLSRILLMYATGIYAEHEQHFTDLLKEDM